MRYCINCSSQLPLQVAANRLLCDECRSRKRLPGKKQSGLTGSESKIKEKYEAKGYEMLRSGWPDFLAVGPRGEVVFVEVKSGGERLTQRQMKIKAVLEKLAQYRVERVKGDRDLTT